MNRYGRKLLFESNDAYGPIEIVEDQFLRSMHFGTPAPQCEMNLKDPFQLTLSYYKHMAMASLFKDHFESALFLGLGGGALPKFFWKHFKTMQLDVVERSYDVVELAYRYFELPHDTRLKIHQADALDFIAKDKNKYDFIFVDLFTKEGISEVSGRKSFFKACRELLRDKSSILIWNTWSLMPPKLMVESIEHLTKYFGSNILILPDRFGNNVFLIFSEKMNRSIEQLRDRAVQLEKETGLEFPELLKKLNDLKGCGLDNK